MPCILAFHVRKSDTLPRCAVENNLLPSKIIPRAVNGTRMRPIGKITLTLQLGDSMYTDDVHIYPNVSGMLISWKAAKSLGILPQCYPRPMDTTIIPVASEHPVTPSVNVTESTRTPTDEEMMKEVFDHGRREIPHIISK